MLGLISDTHNYLDPKVFDLFAGVEHILHAGDIGQRQILTALERLAPVTAVSGNTDESAWNYPLTNTFQWSGHRFLVHHIVNPRAASAILEEAITRHRPSVVVFGHTHKPYVETVAGILYVNPGYAGRSRFAMPRTVALVENQPSGLRVQHLPL